MGESNAFDIAALMDYCSELRLAKVDLSVKTERQDYNEQMRELQLEIVRMQQKVGDYGLRVLLVFEGMDAAGKGGAIKRLTRFLDPRGYRVHSLGPPSQIDTIHHYLRRYWMRLPKRGRITVFDDYSWYSRLLMEPIEGLCSQQEYERTPAQLRGFEQVLAEEDYLLLKFWIHVDQKEQFKRFKRRLANPYKSWKLTPKDWRNRAMYDVYIEHAQRMIDATHAPHAPWFVVPGNDKLFARLQVLRIVVDAIGGYPVQGTPFTRRLEQLSWLEEHGDEPDDD